MEVNSLDDYIGNRKQISTLRTFMEGKINRSAALLVGQPGTGKTTLAHLIATEYGYEPYEINASDSRKKIDAKNITKRSDFTAITLPRLTIIDECDGAREAYMNEILNDPTPKILCANRLDMIPWKIRQKCVVIKFDLPGVYEFRQITKRINKPNPPLKEFRSYRDVDNWAKGGDATGDIILTDDEIISKTMNGETVNVGYSQIEKLIEWFAYSGAEPEIVAHCASLVRDGQIERAIAIIKNSDVTPVKPPFFRKNKKNNRIRLIGLKN